MKLEELKKMELSDLMEARGEKTARQQELRKLSDERELTDEELTEARDLKYDIEQITFELEKRNADNETRKDFKGVHIKPETRKEPGLMDVLRSVISGKKSEELERLDSRGKYEFHHAMVETVGGFSIPSDFRANEVTVTGTTKADGLVEKTVRFIEPLADDLVFAQAGARIQTGLVGNVEFVSGGKIGAEWKGEIEVKEAEKLTVESREFAPKRLSTRIDVSVQLLKQSSVDVEQYIANLMRNAIRAKLESTILGTADIANAPKALFTSVNIKSNTVEANRKNLINTFVNGLRKNNTLSGALSFVTTPAGLSLLSSTPMGVNYLGSLTDYRNPDFLGYKVCTSNGVGAVSGAEAMVFADWTKFFIGNWGGLEITRDPYTRAHEGIVRFILNTYWDAGFVDDNARIIGAIKDPTATASV